jgi:hypothetical protein
MIFEANSLSILAATNAVILFRSYLGLYSTISAPMILPLSDQQTIGDEASTVDGKYALPGIA